MKFDFKNTKGFTFFELIAVISIIAILSLIVFSSLRVSKRFKDSYDAQRSTAVEAIGKGISSYIFDSEGVSSDLGIDNVLRMIGEDDSACNVSCGDFFDYSDSDGLNLALAGTVSVSDNTVDKSFINDGSVANAWTSSNGDGLWFKVDLGASYIVDNVELVGSSGSDRCSVFNIYASDEDSDYGLVYGPVSTEDSEEISFTFSASDRRYWKFVCDTVVNSDFDVYELRVFEAVSDNLALSGTATTSNGSSSSYKINDGTSTTYWFTGPPDGSWSQVDLGESYYVNYAEIMKYTAASAYSCDVFKIHASNDGDSFDLIYGPVSIADSSQTHSFSFDPISYRYWRFVCDEGSSSIFLVREMRVFEARQESSYDVCLDLDSSDLSSYLIEMPQDPEFGSVDKSYYAVRQNGSFTQVYACKGDRVDVSF